MAETADIVIVGAGIIGMSTAVQIARRSALKVVVLDKGSGPGEGSTGASSAVCRYKYTKRETVTLARDGIDAYQNWAEFLGVASPLARFHRDGVVWLSDGRHDWPASEVERLGKLGVRATVLDDQALRERFPAINPCIGAFDRIGERAHDCAGGGAHLLELDGGYVDPMDALQDLIARARSLGVDVRFHSELAGLDIDGARVTGIRTKRGERVACGAVVNAAGPWCNAVFAMAEIVCRWPLKPTRIQVAHVDAPPDIGSVPVSCDTLGGIYFRAQNRGQQIIVGSILEEDEREVVVPDNFARYADDGFIREKLHVLQHRLPALSPLRNVRGYSGLYTMNVEDVHPIVGPTPVKGFYAANGFSGHGFKLAPAIGSLLAQMLTCRRASFDTDVEAAFLAYDREPVHVATKSVLA